MKSAYELALERMAQQGIDAPDAGALDDATRARIAEARKLTEAKRAELEILHRDAVGKSRDAEAIRELESQYRRDRERLDDGLETKLRPVSYTHLTLPTNREV